MKAKSIKNKLMWGYFAPDGYLQVRTIAYTKSISREFLPHKWEEKTFVDYENAGYKLKRISVTIISETNNL